jgi:hypothetical protein
MRASDEFYIGYSAAAPPRTAFWVRRTVAVTIVMAIAVAVLLVVQQQPFPAATFEYGNPRTFAGIIREQPLPQVEIEGGRTALLVAPGKHGAADLIRGLDGRRADFTGTRIERTNNLMLELAPGSIRPMPAAPEPAQRWINAGPAELRGEIVDSKCYLGVMNPGEGKVHRDCAARCISGGVPPALVARDRDGRVRLLPITGPAGAPINKSVLPYVAEPVVVRGSLFRLGNQLRIEADPENIRRAE